MTKIFCARCREFLFLYKKEDFSGPIEPEDFIVARAGVPAPQKGKPASCGFCKKPFYLMRKTGAIVVLTDKGFMPRPPTGTRFIPPTTPASFPMTSNEADYQEPTHRSRKR